VGVSYTPCSRRPPPPRAVGLPPATGLPTPALPPSLPAAPPAGTALPLPQPSAFRRQVHPFPPPARRASLPSPPPPASLPGAPAAAPAPSAPRRPPFFPAAGPPLRCRSSFLLVAPRRAAAAGRHLLPPSRCVLRRATRARPGAWTAPPALLPGAPAPFLPLPAAVSPAAPPLSTSCRRGPLLCPPLLRREGLTGTARSPCTPSCRAAVGRPGRGSSRVRAARSPLVRPASVSQWPSAPLASLRWLGSVPVPWRRPRHT
jgi:hypothetical protein